MAKQTRLQVLASIKQGLQDQRKKARTIRDEQMNLVQAMLWNERVVDPMNTAIINIENMEAGVKKILRQQKFTTPDDTFGGLI